MLVLDVAGDRSRGCAQKLLHHLAADQDGMTMYGGAFAQDFRHDSPDVGVGREKGLAEIDEPSPAAREDDRPEREKRRRVRD